MYTKTVAALRGEVSGRTALSYVQDISSYHRIQGSPGFRKAATYCRDAMLSQGIDTRVHSYPADGLASYWTCRSWEEWECEMARLTLLEPEQAVLADFMDCPISLIQRSHATPPGGLDLEIVYVDNADKPESYTGLDLSGKMVFGNGDVARIRRLALSRGASGMMTDNMNEWPPVRTRMDIPDARQYTSFWLSKDDAPFFGFVLSPRQGDLIRQMLKQGKTVRVRAEVKATFYPGAFEVVDALIPGTEEGEVWGVAHLCHPKPSANDNASGAGALIEAARAINALVKAHKIPKPKRSIRFLLVPEMTGTYCYLSSNEHLIPKVAAAVNLDMVGENQDLCKGPLIVEKPPRATGSFSGELLSAIMSEVTNQATNLGGTFKYSLIKQVTTPFSGGSDHYILADPSVGIPCPMLIQWPDKFYHTSEDTIDKVDPAMLSHVSLAVASYLYFLANAGYPESVFISNLVAADFMREVSHITSIEDCDKLPFLLDRRVNDLQSVTRLVKTEDATRLASIHQSIERQLEEIAGHVKQRVMSLEPCAGDAPIRSTDFTDAAVAMIPVRKYKGPVDSRGLSSSLTPEDRAAWEEYQRAHKSIRRIATHALYYADGKRNVAEIADIVEMETNTRDVGALLELFNVLRKAGFVE